MYAPSRDSSCVHNLCQFTTWTTYTDGLVIGVDLKVTEDYMSCLKHFSTLGHIEHRDHETRNRYVLLSASIYQVLQYLNGISTRLVGLAALVGAVNSEALYHSLTHFQPQVTIMLRALLLPFFQVDISVLDHE